jgi:hypothetical protein
MTDAISEMARNERERSSREASRKKYLGAALRYFIHRSKASLADVVDAYDPFCRAMRQDTEGRSYVHQYDAAKVAEETRTRFGALMNGVRDAWMKFLLEDVGIADGEMRAIIMAYSPFHDCLIIVSQPRHEAGPEMFGDTAAFMAAIAAKGSATVKSVYEAVIEPEFVGNRQGARFHVYRVTPNR